jgi:uncharacterized integral membrane protein
MTSQGQMARAERRVRADQTIRVILWLLVAAAIVTFALANRDDVSVDWLYDTTTAPLSLVIGASAVGGALIGYLARSRRR